MTEEATDVTLMRHGPTHYDNYCFIEEDGDPNKYVDYKKQVPDLDQRKLQFVRRKTDAFARSIDSRDAVVVLSSCEMRAYQIAYELVTSLERKNKTVVDMSGFYTEDRYPIGINKAAAPRYKKRGGIITLDKRIVPVDFASLAYKSMWAQDMLEPPTGHRKSDGSLATTFEGINVSKIPSRRDRRDYEKARRIIEKIYENPEWIDAGWGDNWALLHKLEPFKDHIPSVGENTRRMVDGIETILEGKYAPQSSEMRVRYVVVSHEEMLIGFTSGTFGQTRVEHCERLDIRIPKDREQLATGTYKGEERIMPEFYASYLVNS
jgi:hypothetical protein